jgi:TonB-linked SusC/RagA family outer membrane protein
VLGVQTANALQEDGNAAADDLFARGAPRLLTETKHGRVPIDVASTPLLSNRIGVDFNDVPIRDALAVVARKAGIRLMYADDVFPANDVVRLRAEGITVAAALTDLLDRAGVDVVFTAPGDASLVRRPPLPPVGAVSGTVTDSAGLPIVAVTMLVEGTQFGAITDAVGRYRIAGVRAGQQTVVARRIGYQPVSKKVDVQDGASASLDFVLAASVSSLKALVVTGTTGAVERITQAAVVSSVDAADIQSVMPATDAVQLLAGTVAGASVSATGGQTGDALHMYIRGPSSVFLNNEPLVFIDGIRVNSTPRALLGLGGQQGNPLEELNPDDIASMEIVKGPAAATLYGADASAGVINILTKHGGAGALAQTLTLDGSQNDAGYTPYTNYAKCSAAAVLSTSSSALCHGLGVGSIISDNPILRTGAFRIGDGEKIDYSLRGGGAGFGYFGSASVSNEQGVEVPNGIHGYTARGNFYWTATPKLTFNLGMNLADNDNFLSNGDQGTAISLGAFEGNPLTVFKTASGGLDGGWTNSPGTELARYNSLLQEYHTLRSTPDAQVNYKPFSWFNNRLQLGADVQQTLANSYSPIDAALTGTSAVGSSTNIQQASNVYTLNYTGTIHTDFGSSKNSMSDLTFGTQYIETDLNTLGGLGQSFLVNQANLAGLGASTAVTSQSVTTQKSFGMLLQDDLGFDKKVFMQLGVRIDKNSSFGAGAPSFVLPKVGLSYVLSEEKYWKPLQDFIQTFRVRGAWGSTGRSPPPGASLTTYSAAAYAVGNAVNPGVALNNPGNSNLKAELGTEFEGGFDATFFHERASIEVTFFDKTSTNLLMQEPLPPSLGYASNPYVNIGRVNNSGFEVSLRASPVTSRQVTWDVVLSGSTLKNKVISLGNVAPFYNQTAVYPGYPLGSYFANGYISTNVATNSNIVTDTAVYQGNSNPSLVANITNTVMLFGRLKLYALFITKRGFKVNDGTEYFRDEQADNAGGIYLPYGQGGYSPTKMTQIFGTNTGQNSGAPIIIGRTSALWFEGGDFVRFQELSASLPLPNSLVRAAGGTTASFTFGGTNLMTWTKYPGLDPDASSFTPEYTGGGAETLTRNDVFAAPPPRRWFGRFTFQF